MTEKGRIVKMVSQDQEEFEVEYGVATMSTLISNVLQDVSEETTTVPIPNVNAQVLAKVIEYCRYHYEAKRLDQSEEDIERWNKDFMKVDNKTLFNILIAASFLDIADLLDLGCKTVAGMIKDKSVEQIRELFCIEGDFTEEQEAKMREENNWGSEMSQENNAAQ
mmetsp:Transcript_34456/g.135562  ORF Transcript_34456/g.135562 Transcript_34456/m.135562 type:complete len:165 (-) Transcript_34456:193-687(-)